MELGLASLLSTSMIRLGPETTTPPTPLQRTKLSMSKALWYTSYPTFDLLQPFHGDGIVGMGDSEAGVADLQYSNLAVVRESTVVMKCLS